MDYTHPPIGSFRTVRIPFACPLPFRRTALYRYFFCGMEFEHRCRRRTTCPNELSPARRQPGRSDGGYLCRPLACLDSNASILPAVCRLFRCVSCKRIGSDFARTCRQPPVAYAGRRLPPNIFVFIFLNGFLSAAAGILLTGIIVVAVLDGIHAFGQDVLWTAALPVFILIAWAEAFLSGIATAIFVALKPHWINTFDDNRYLKSDRSIWQ